jgi:hypothetical protein
MVLPFRRRHKTYVLVLSPDHWWITQLQEEGVNLTNAELLPRILNSGLNKLTQPSALHLGKQPGLVLPVRSFCLFTTGDQTYSQGRSTSMIPCGS